VVAEIRPGDRGVLTGNIHERSRSVWWLKSGLVTGECSLEIYMKGQGQCDGCNHA